MTRYICVKTLSETKDRKRTISKTFKDGVGLGGFIGWDKVENILSSLDDELLWVFVGLLSTGCRAGELCKIRRDQINLDFSKDQVQLSNVYVSKWRNKVGSRTFYLNKSEPTYPYFETIVSHTPEGSPVFPFTYNQIYYRVAQIEAPTFNKESGARRTDWTHYKGGWWPHRIRAEKACQLIVDYRLSSFALKKWFGWRTDNMPTFYGDMLPLDVADMMLKPQYSFEVKPERLLRMNDEQRAFILDLLEEK